MPVWDEVDAVNDAMRAHCAANAPRLTYVDVNPGLFEEGSSSPGSPPRPRFNLYREDGLHFVDRAYDDVLLPVIKAALERALGEVKAARGEGEAAHLPPGMRR
jgi:hypothetical protein